MAGSSRAPPLSAAAVAALVALLPAGALTEDAPFEQRFAAWDGDHVLVYALEPWGDVPFKVAMDFYQPVEVARFVAMARAHGPSVAYAADEWNAHVVRHHVVDRDSTRLWLLSFEETATSYTCNRVGVDRAAGNSRS